MIFIIGDANMRPWSPTTEQVKNQKLIIKKE